MPRTVINGSFNGKPLATAFQMDARPKNAVACGLPLNEKCATFIREQHSIWNSSTLNFIPPRSQEYRVQLIANS